MTLQSHQEDFTYSPDYFEDHVMLLEGGASLDILNFAPLYCPLTPMLDSGHFVIAKFLNKERTKIAITGFQVDY